MRNQATKWTKIFTQASRLAAAALALSFAVGAVHAAPVTIRTAAQDSNTFKFDPKNAKLPGMCMEVMQAMEKVDPEIKFTGQTTMTPLPRILSEMESGGLDGFCGLLKNPERLAKFTFLDPAVYFVKHKVAVRADDTVKVSNFEDIRKLPAGENTIITTAGTAWVPFLEQQGGLKVDAGSKDNGANLQKLLANRGRFFYQAETSLAEYIDNEKLQGKVKILPAVFKEEGQHFVLAKSTPAAVVDKVHAALEKLAKQGELAKIYAKYVP